MPWIQPKTSPVVELPSAPILRNMSLITDNACALCRLYGHYSHHYQKIFQVLNGSSQHSTTFPWIKDHSDRRSSPPTSFFGHHVHLHDVQFYRPSCLHHHQWSIKPVSSIISTTPAPSTAKTSVATSTLVIRETMGFIPTQHDPFPFPFHVPTIPDRE